MDLLVYLAERQGEVLSHDQIFRDVWCNIATGDAALQTAVSNLRKALDDNPRKPTVIATVPKRGYRLIADSSAPQPTLAVLPFENLSRQPDQTFFSDGMTDALIAELGKVRALRVISRQSTMAFRDGSTSLPEIAGRLRVRLIVLGSAIRVGEKARISVQLIDARTDAYLLSETYERDLADLATMYTDTATSIARSIADRLRLEPAVVRAANKALHPDALVAYLRGRFCWYKMVPQQFHAALEYFRAAIEIDPEYAAAHAGVADVLGAFAYWGMQSPSSVRAQVREAIERAERCDSQSAETQMLSGAYCFYYDHDWAQAEDRFRRAIDLNPNLAHARLLYALFLGTMDRPQAIDELDLARRIDPVNPAVYLGRAMWFAAQGAFDDARHDIDLILETHSDHPPGLQLLADLEWLAGSKGAIEAELRAWAGDPELQAILDDQDSTPPRRLMAAIHCLQLRATKQYVQPRQVARLLVHAGRLDEAIDILERARASDDLMQIDFLRLGAAFTRLRDKPRFRALLDELSLP